MKPATQDDAGSGKKGDVNSDGQVNISDVTVLVNIILGKDKSSAAKARGTEEE